MTGRTRKKPRFGFWNRSEVYASIHYLGHQKHRQRDTFISIHYYTKLCHYLCATFGEINYSMNELFPRSTEEVHNFFRKILISTNMLKIRNFKFRNKRSYSNILKYMF